MNWLLILASISLVTVLPGCAMVETTTQVEDVAFLTFKGVADGASFQLDGGTPQQIERWPDSVRYQIAPGRHSLIVSRNGDVIVRREIYLTTGQVFELSLPQE